MFTYTTCIDCGGHLHITRHGQTVHPGCTPQPSKVEQLTQDWLAAAAEGALIEATRLEDQIEELENRTPRLLDAALTYATWGWLVFPLKPQSKTPATRHGFKDATNDHDRLRAWWTRHPDHNIGLPTGIAFDVIDIDLPDGMISYRRMLELVDPRTGTGPLPDCHGRVITASGGLHLYIPVGSNANKAGLLPGIDVRGAGGYVVAPPSTLGDRRQSWAWAVKPSPTLIPTAKAAAA